MAGDSAPKKRSWRWLRWTLLLLLVAGGGLAFYAWRTLYAPVLPEGRTRGYDLRIARGTTFEGLITQMKADTALANESAFRLTARVLRYENVKPGRYLFPAGVSCWDMIRKLRSGAQDALRLHFRSHRTLTELADELGPQLEMGRDTLLRCLQDDAFLSPYSMTTQTVAGMFLPNTYEVYWNIQPRAFLNRMHEEYEAFWNAERRAAAEAQQLSPAEVIVLASIVQSETHVATERSTVAGLYLNRIRQHIPLQADPTVIFANGDFTVRRVTNAMLEIDSPYNTYKYAGLPPGPINNPELSALEAVLHPASHDYLFMCAKCDFSGHNFSSTLAQHNRYAQEYHRCLNQQGVFR